MKILYGIQGTGNGHISRAMEIIPELKKRGEVDLLISGMHSELRLPFDVKYQYHGLGFVFGKKGGIDLVETYKKSRLKQFFKEVKSLDLSSYDLVISDFEPITAWSAMRHQRTCIGLSNQVSLLHSAVPKGSSEDFVGRFIIRNYAPTAINLGFSYRAYGKEIFTPVIRRALRERELSEDGHLTVYLPSYSDEKIIKTLGQVKNARFQVFSKYALEASSFSSIEVFPLEKEQFEDSITRSSGVITAAGFGTTTEALFMGKKLLVVPQKNQYEQACNALALKGLGVRVIKSLKLKHLDKIQYWVDHGTAIKMDYPDHTEKLVDEILYAHLHQQDAYTDYLLRDQYQLKTA